MSDSHLCKIIYFDEDSVTDYVQILDGGELEKTTELLKDVNDTVKGDTEIKGSIGIPKLIKALMGSNLDISADASIGATYSKEKIVKNIIKNTILTDFINIVEEKGEKQDAGSVIKKFVNYKICAPKDSLSYVSLISPYLSMFRGGNIPAGDYNIALEKLDNTIKSAKGYYEFIGEKKIENTDEKTKAGGIENTKETEPNKKIILRFNINSFKNNYKPTDLLKMDICIYAIKVGKSTIDKLDFNNEFNIKPFSQDNPSYHEDDTITESIDNEEYPVYDVLLAGVEA